MKTYLKLAILGCCAAGFVGCESEEKTDEEMAQVVYDEEMIDTSDDAIFGHLTPGLLTMTDRGVDAEAKMNIRWNSDARLFWEDWGRVLMFDRPSRLTPRPMP